MRGTADAASASPAKPQNKLPQSRDCGKIVSLRPLFSLLQHDILEKGDIGTMAIIYLVELNYIFLLVFCVAYRSMGILYTKLFIKNNKAFQKNKQKISRALNCAFTPLCCLEISPFRIFKFDEKLPLHRE